MDTGPKRPTSVFYILMTLGMLCLVLLGIWLSCLATLREEMSISQSPMVGGAPFLNIFFIFLFAWLSYTFFGDQTAATSAQELHLQRISGFLWHRLHKCINCSIKMPAASVYSSDNSPCAFDL